LEDDRQRILKEIEGSIGFSALDVAIREALVESARLNLVHIEAQLERQQEVRHRDHKPGQELFSRTSIAHLPYLNTASAGPGAREISCKSCQPIMPEDIAHAMSFGRDLSTCQPSEQPLSSINQRML